MSLIEALSKSAELCDQGNISEVAKSLHLFEMGRLVHELRHTNKMTLPQIRASIHNRYSEPFLSQLCSCYAMFPNPIDRESATWHDTWKARKKYLNAQKNGINTTPKEFLLETIKERTIRAKQIAKRKVLKS